MKSSLLTELYDEFQKNELGKAVGMKFMYYFQRVEISVYFDGYDEGLPVFMLMLSYEGERCFFSCNVYEMNGDVLEEIILPEKIKKQIIFQKSYDMFWKRLDQELEAREYVFRNYKADFPFKQMEQVQYEIYGMHPFFGGLMEGEMEDDYMKLLHRRFPFSWELLTNMKQKGITVVTVGKCKERKKLGRELAKYNLAHV